jgi:hypothetical protein
MKTVSTYNANKRAKTASQSRKRVAVGSDEREAINSLQRREMQDALNWMVSEREKSYRWIAKHTIGASRFGWLQRVATGKRDVKPTKSDLVAVRRLFDLLQEQNDIDGKRLDYMLRMTQLLADLQRTISDYMRMERTA